MARLPRVCPVGIPQHIIQRGNNRQICFVSEQDFAVFANWLGEYAREAQVDLHAWVFMTNHVHLLVTPNEQGATSKMMQALGRRYVRYFNSKYQRTGTLWEGRFRASLVQSENYLLVCQRYIELNPVRAKMVPDPAQYSWSSYQAHGLGKAIGMHSPHSEYLSLDSRSQTRQAIYRDLFVDGVSQEHQTSIREAVNKGMALGDDKFKVGIEQSLGRRLRPAVMGRPLKNAP